MNRRIKMVSAVAVGSMLSMGWPARVALSVQPDSQRAAAVKLDEAKSAEATATIAAAANQKEKITGTVTFTQEGDKVKVVADIDGLTPGEHGFHIHEKPDLSAPDLSSAGGHFNPDHHHHGGPGAAEHHAGDLGNLTADDKGHAHLEVTVAGLSIDGEKNGVVGHCVIIHAKPDDLKSDPSGNSGPRIAGGVIEIKKA